MANITKRTIDSLMPRETDYFVWDDELAGFGVRVMRSGKKSYVVQYRAGGRTRRNAFSRVGTMTPDEARKHARGLLVAVDKGQDPVAEIEAQRRTPTVAALCERFMTEHVPHRCKPSTQKEYRRSVDLFIKPALGTFKVNDVKRADIAKLHGDMHDIPYQANRTLGVLEEIGRLGRVLDTAERDGSEPKPVIAAIRLLMLTGARLSEIQTLKWEHVRDCYLGLPDSKTGAKRIVLGKEAAETLNRIIRVPGNPYVIVGTLRGRHWTDLQRPWRRIRTKAELSDLRIHDLRHTFASIAAGGGESLTAIGKLLGHSQVQTTARYAHLAPDPVRAAADRVANEIKSAMLAASLRYKAADSNEPARIAAE